jgi:anaerobic magnesium-protoporphyrin IX monomethyl ester cyclase
MAHVLLTRSYHALRDALCAEVTAWNAPTDSSDPSTGESLWHRVHKMEPVCRNMNVLSLPEFSPSETESTFLPLEDFIVGIGRP